MEVGIALIGSTVLCLTMAALLAYRETQHAKEIRELATLAVTTRNSTTVDESIRAVALTREALAIDVQPPPAKPPAEEIPEKQTKGFTTVDGLKLELATPFPREMLDSIPNGRRIT